MRGATAALTLALVVGASAFAPRSSPFARRSQLAMSFYDLSDTDTTGAKIDFAQFKDKVVYCQNVRRGGRAVRLRTCRCAF
jgi:hypothetical protein